MSSGDVATLDDIITRLGFGRYQICNYIILSAVMLFHPFQILMIPFIGQKLDHVPTAKCNITTTLAIRNSSNNSNIGANRNLWNLDDRSLDNGTTVLIGFSGPPLLFNETSRSRDGGVIPGVEIIIADKVALIDSESALPLPSATYPYDIVKYLCRAHAFDRNQRPAPDLAYVLNSSCHITRPADDLSNENRTPWNSKFSDGVNDKITAVLECREVRVEKTKPSPPRDSIISEWDLRGPREYLVPLASSIFMIGSVIGSFFFAITSDKWGRKRMLLLSVFVFSSCSIVPAIWAPTYSIFVTFRFFQGVCHSGNMIVHMVMLAELLPKEKRYLSLLLGTILFSIGYVSLSVLAYLLLKWRSLQLVTGILMATFILTIPFLDESIYWLMDTGKIGAAHRLIIKAAKENKCPDAEAIATSLSSQKMKSVKGVGDPTVRPLLLDNSADDQTRIRNVRGSYKIDPDTLETLNEIGTVSGTEIATLQPPAVQLKTTKEGFRHQLMLDLFRYPVLRKRTLIAGICSFFLFQFHMALTFSVHILPGSLYLNYALMGLTEIPGSLLGVWAIKIGRRRPVIAFNGLCILSLVVRIAVERVGIRNFTVKKYFDIALYLIGRCISGGNLAVISLYISELYPTYIRNTGYGLNNAVNRLGFMISPFVAYLADYNAIYIPCLLITFCILASVSVTFLPDTKDKPLPQTLEDLKTV